MTQNIEAFMDRPEVASLDLSAFGPADLENLVLQRSQVLYDAVRPGRVIRAWENGDDAPLKAEVARLGETIARRAAANIFGEFLELRETLDQVAPKRIADIGCGYALFDLFAAKTYGCDLMLIDLESNDRRHFGFKGEGAAYTSLSVARAHLENNGISPASILTVNPEQDDVLAHGEVDLAVSFLSCGFHYPVAPYLPFLEHNLRPGGSAIFDLRAATADKMLTDLTPFGTIAELPSQPKARRVLLKKATS